MNQQKMYELEKLSSCIPYIVIDQQHKKLYNICGKATVNNTV